jgi:hypothetical protein
MLAELHGCPPPVHNLADWTLGDRSEFSTRPTARARSTCMRFGLVVRDELKAREAQQFVTYATPPAAADDR